MGVPVGLTFTTGLDGLVDLIGLDVMNHIGENLAVSLPAWRCRVGLHEVPRGGEGAPRARSARPQDGRRLLPRAEGSHGLKD